MFQARIEHFRIVPYRPVTSSPLSLAYGPPNADADGRDTRSTVFPAQGFLLVAPIRDGTAEISQVSAFI